MTGKDYERASFHIQQIKNPETLPADFLWLGIKVQHKMKNKADTESQWVTQLQQRYPDSTQYRAFLQGEFDE